MRSTDGGCHSLNRTLQQKRCTFCCCTTNTEPYRTSATLQKAKPVMRMVSKTVDLQLENSGDMKRIQIWLERRRHLSQVFRKLEIWGSGNKVLPVWNSNVFVNARVHGARTTSGPRVQPYLAVVILNWCTSSWCKNHMRYPCTTMLGFYKNRSLNNSGFVCHQLFQLTLQ